MATGILAQAAGNNDGRLTTSEINKAYQNLFGRPADQAGLDYWGKNANEANLYQKLADGARNDDLKAMEYGVSKNLNPDFNKTWNTQEFSTLENQLNQSNNNLRFNTTANRWESENPNQIDIVAPDVTAGQAASYTPNMANQTTNVPVNNYNAQQAEAAQYELTSDGLVQNRLNNLLDENSDWVQLNRNQALQQMNGRGLLNSSMTASAGQRAAIEATMPIARDDAASVNQVGLSNTAAQNQINLANQAATNTAARDNANAANQMGQFNASLEQQTELANQTANNRAGEYNATNAQQMSIANMQAINNAASQFASAQNNASLQAAQNNFNSMIADLQTQLSYDQLAAGLFQTGMAQGAFSTVEGGAAFVQFVSDAFPAIGIGITRDLAEIASANVV